MKQEPLLSDSLTDGKRAALASLVLHPGFQVLEEMHFEAVKRAKDEILRVDPEEAGSDHKIRVRHIKARERNEFSLLILNSIQWHIQALKNGTDEKNAKPNQNPIVRPLYEVKGKE